LAGSLLLLLGCATASMDSPRIPDQAQSTDTQCSEEDRQRARSITSSMVATVDPENVRVHVGKGLGEERLVGARVVFRAPADWNAGVLVQAARCSQAAFLLRGMAAAPIDHLWEAGRWIDVEPTDAGTPPQTVTLVLKTVTGDAAQRLLDRVRDFAGQP